MTPCLSSTAWDAFKTGAHDGDVGISTGHGTALRLLMTAVIASAPPARCGVAAQLDADLVAARDGGAVAHGIRQLLAQQRLHGGQLPRRQLREALANV